MTNRGQYTIIEPDVAIGDFVKIGHNVTLKNGTWVGSYVELADYVKTTGLCIIGNHVSIRTGACISKSVIIEDWAFIGPGVMTNHTKNVVHGRPHLKPAQLITRIGFGAVVGSMCSLVAGVTIGDNVMLAAGTNVYRDILEAGVYGGNPIRKMRDVDPAFILKRPTDYQPYQFSEDKLREYLPHWEGFTR